MSGNISRRAKRKKQTRLGFEPVDLTSEDNAAPSSSLSPARITYQKDGPSSPFQREGSFAAYVDLSSPLEAFRSSPLKSSHDPNSSERQRNGKLNFKRLSKEEKAEQDARQCEEKRGQGKFYDCSRVPKLWQGF